ncbi:head-tail connector protein [Moraxella sp. ZY200743]|uniref:head-tail connector protein n=1 Tax=Moraxella sp. ZY200743 TaxID=2911970 RepID=UPI003D7DF177
MITLEQVKHQCRIEHDDEDELLRSYISAAYDYVSNFTSREFEDNGGDLEYTPSINQACLMLITHWYENREATKTNMVTITQVPFGVQYLLTPYRVMGV